MTAPAPAALLSIATHAAREAAVGLAEHHRRRGAGQDLGVQHKSTATDPVSVADDESEGTLVEVITSARPDDGILGEEGARRDSRSGLRWVVDPLDGTVNYLYGHRGWSVSVAVERQCGDGTWQGIAGVVFDPLADEMFAAADDIPATCNGAPINVNDPVEIPMALVATGFSYDRAQRARQARTVAAVLSHARDIRRVGSAALDLCAVAAGRVDAYYEDTTNRWDTAAGAVIVRCAGGRTGPLDGGAAGHLGILAAGPALFPALRDLIAPH